MLSVPNQSLLLECNLRSVLLMQIVHFNLNSCWNGASSQNAAPILQSAGMQFFSLVWMRLPTKNTKKPQSTP